MKFAMKSIVAATALVAAGVASAASVTVAAGTGVYNGTGLPDPGYTLTGSGSMIFSGELMGAMDTGKVAISSYAPGTVNFTKDTDGFYTSVSAAGVVSSFTIDNATNQVLSSATSGGASQTATVIKSVSSGGSLTVTDLNVDLVNKKVYATLIGGNGVGTLTNFYLFDILGTALYDSDGNYIGNDASTAIVGPGYITGPGTFTTQFNGLHITAAGLTKFSKAMGLYGSGASGLGGVNDFGSIVSTITVTPAVPEPATYALMGLGLVGMSLVARRRAK